MLLLQLVSSSVSWICGSTVKHKVVYSTAVTPELCLEVTLWACRTPSAQQFQGRTVVMWQTASLPVRNAKRPRPLVSFHSETFKDWALCLCLSAFYHFSKGKKSWVCCGPLEFTSICILGKYLRSSSSACVKCQNTKGSFPYLLVPQDSLQSLAVREGKKYWEEGKCAQAVIASHLGEGLVCATSDEVANAFGFYCVLYSLCTVVNNRGCREPGSCMLLLFMQYFWTLLLAWATGHPHFPLDEPGGWDYAEAHRPSSGNSGERCSGAAEGAGYTGNLFTGKVAMNECLSICLKEKWEEGWRQGSFAVALLTKISLMICLISAVQIEWD